jgi:hypothetical protein
MLTTVDTRRIRAAAEDLARELEAEGSEVTILTTTKGPGRALNDQAVATGSQVESTAIGDVGGLGSVASRGPGSVQMRPIRSCQSA